MKEKNKIVFICTVIFINYYTWISEKGLCLHIICWVLLFVSISSSSDENTSIDYFCHITSIDYFCHIWSSLQLESNNKDKYALLLVLIWHFRLTDKPTTNLAPPWLFYKYCHDNIFDVFSYLFPEFKNLSTVLDVNISAILTLSSLALFCFANSILDSWFPVNVNILRLLFPCSFIVLASRSFTQSLLKC